MSLRDEFTSVCIYNGSFDARATNVNTENIHARVSNKGCEDIDYHASGQVKYRRGIIVRSIEKLIVMNALVCRFKVSDFLNLGLY
jgi:hypothetical protein